MILASPLTDQLQGWGTAVGALAAIGAFIAAALAYRGQRQQLAHQAQELAALAEQQDREADERRREQVSQVFVSWTLSLPGLTCAIQNSSRFPVYNLVPYVVYETGLKKRQETAQHLLPGEHRRFTVLMATPTMEAFKAGRSVVMVELTDAAGRRWRITTQGRIEPIAE